MEKVTKKEEQKAKGKEMLLKRENLPKVIRLHHDHFNVQLVPWYGFENLTTNVQT